MHLARAVGGEDDDGRFGRVDGAEFGDCDLKIRQSLQQEGLEGFIRAVQFVDQQDRRAARLRAHGLQKRAFDQVVFGKEFRCQRVAVGPACGFGGADGDHLRGEVPFIDGGGGIQAFIALQADQAATEGGGDGLGDLGLAGAGLAFQKEGPAQFQRQEGHSGQRPPADIILCG